MFAHTLEGKDILSKAKADRVLVTIGHARKQIQDTMKSSIAIPQIRVFLEEQEKNLDELDTGIDGYVPVCAVEDEFAKVYAEMDTAGCSLQ